MDLEKEASKDLGFINSEVNSGRSCDRRSGFL